MQSHDHWSTRLMNSMEACSTLKPRAVDRDRDDQDIHSRPQQNEVVTQRSNPWTGDSPQSTLRVRPIPSEIFRVTMRWRAKRWTGNFVTTSMHTSNTSYRQTLRLYISRYNEQHIIATKLIKNEDRDPRHSSLLRNLELVNSVNSSCKLLVSIMLISEFIFKDC